MKLYVKRHVPSVLKVQIFADECSQILEVIEVEQTAAPGFLRMNPFGTVPVLQMDSGDFITESLTICRYLNSRWRSALFGRGDDERLQVELWERRAELLLFVPGIEFVHQVHPSFALHFEQNSAWAKTLARRAANSLGVFEERLKSSRFLAAELFTISDITAYLGISAFVAFNAFDLASYPAVKRWSDELGTRRSMEPLRAMLQ